MAQQNALNNRSSQLSIDPGTSGDSYIQFNINTTGKFRVGVDDDASDAFKISSGSALGTNDTFIITAAGEVTRPLNPSFLGYIPSQDANVTGDGTNYQLGTNVAYTEIFDQGSDFTTAGVFTAPVTGRYLLSAHVQLLVASGSGSSVATAVIVTSNRSYYGTNIPTREQIAGFYGVSESVSYSAVCVADMDAADTATARIGAYSGTKTSDVNAGSSSTLYTFFSGYLIS